jgi:hypothetical protein
LFQALSERGFSDVYLVDIVDVIFGITNVSIRFFVGANLCVRPVADESPFQGFSGLPLHKNIRKVSETAGNLPVVLLNLALQGLVG